MKALLLFIFSCKSLVTFPYPKLQCISLLYSFYDNYTKLTWVYLLRNKSKAFVRFCNSKAQAEPQLRCKIKNIQYDMPANTKHLLSSYDPLNFIIAFLVLVHVNEMVVVRDRKWD